MADEEATTTEETKPEGEETDVEKQAFLERLNKESDKRKAAEKRAQEHEKELKSIKAQMEEREQQGLPELDQMKKRLEAAEKRAEEADNRAKEFEAQATNTRREQWVSTAAAGQNFIDPDDAVRYVDLSEIESADEAERAVKRVAKAKAHLLRDEDPQIPGRVLENGRTAPTAKKGNIDLDDEAQMISANLKQFLQNR